jgi:uncharacterized protein
MMIEQVEKQAIPILQKARVRRAAVFGSVARGEADAYDVDFLVEMQKPYGLFALLELKGNLEEVLKVSVDVVEYSTLKPKIKERALSEAIEIL